MTTAFNPRKGDSFAINLQNALGFFHFSKFSRIIGVAETDGQTRNQMDPINDYNFDEYNDFDATSCALGDYNSFEERELCYDNRYDDDSDEYYEYDIWD